MFLHVKSQFFAVFAYFGIFLFQKLIQCISSDVACRVKLGTTNEKIIIRCVSECGVFLFTMPCKIVFTLVFEAYGANDSIWRYPQKNFANNRVTVINMLLVIVYSIILKAPLAMNNFLLCLLGNFHEKFYNKNFVNDYILSKIFYI